MDFGEIYASVGKLTQVQYLISLIGSYGWTMDHLDMVNTFLNPKIDNDNINMMWPNGWPEGLNAPKIIVTPRKGLCSLKPAPWLWHDDITSFLLSPGLT